MKKKRAALGISLLLLILTSAFFWYFPVREPALADDLLTWQELQSYMEALKTTEEDILGDLIFAGERLPCDRASGTFYLPVDMEVTRWESGSLTSGQKDVKVYLLDNPLEDDKQKSVREGKSYRLLAVRDDVCREYAVVFTGLPILSIETDEEIRYEEVYGSMRLLLADTKEDWAFESLMSGHIRGGSSRLNPKKSYKMTLYKQNQIGSGDLRKNQVSLLNMRKDDEWILYSIYSEDTKLRDKLSLDIWNESGALCIESGGHYGYHMEYIEVFQNDTYRGLYGLMEPVDYKQLDLTKEGEAQPEEFLYKQKDADVFELKGNHKAEDEAHFEVLNQYLSLLNAEDAVFAEEIPKLIDVDSALEVWIYLQAVLGMDNIERNIFYPVRYEEGQYRMYFMPWDMDYSWGNVHDFDALNRSRPSREIWTMRIAWRLGDRLVELNVEDAREKVANRWRSLREGVYSDAYLRSHIRAYAHQMIDSGAFWRDEALWYDSQHSEDFDGLADLACDRMRFLDEWLLKPLSYLDIEEYIE